jgi:hypothetical protein
MAANDDVNKVNENLRKTTEELSYVADAFTSLAAQLEEVFSTALGNAEELDSVSQSIAKSYQRDIVSSIKQMSKNTEQQIALQQKVAKGEDISRQLAAQREKNEARRLITLQKINLAEGLSTEQKALAITNLQEQFNIENEILGSLEKQNEELAAQNAERERAQGLTGSALKGIEGTLKKAGFGDLAKKLNFDGAIKGATTFDKETGKATFNAGKAFSNVGKNLAANVTKGDMLTLVLKKLVERAGQADKNIANLRRNFSATFNEARKLNDGFAFTALKTGDVTANVESLGEANQNINNQLGIQVRYNDDLLVQANALVKRNKLSAEAAAGFSELTLASGVSAEELVKKQSQVTAAVQNSSKVALNFNQVLEEANKTTGLLRVNLGKTPEGIAKAVAQAKTLGITLNEAAQISGKLLDFQSSIEAELEAEVLTGKQLNLEQARFLALQGKTDEAAAEVLKQVGSLAEFQQMNVLQQQALADATGLTVDQLADQVTKQAAINSQKQDGLNIDAEAQTENASALSVQERLTSAVEKLNSILQITGIIVGGILGAIAFALAPFTGGASLAAFVGGGAALGLGAQAVMDGEAPASGGPFTITDKYGATAITTSGDGIAVGPNINRGGGGMSDAKMDKMITLLEKMANKSTTLQMDGRVLAKTIETSPVSSNIG